MARIDTGRSDESENSEKDPKQVDLRAVHARQEACESAELSLGAKVLFTRLLDLSLDPDQHRPGPKGQVLIGQMKLATLLKRSERRIRAWTAELIEQRFVWTTRVLRTNTHPMIRYHMSAYLPPQQAKPDVRGEGMMGNCRRRLDPVIDLNRDRKGQFRRLGGLILDVFGKPIFSNLAENGAGNGHNVPVGADKNAGGSGHKLPVGAVIFNRSLRKEVAAPSGQKRPLSGPGNGRSNGKEASDLKETQIEPEPVLESGGTGSPPESAEDRALKVWERSLEGRFESRLAKMREQFRDQRKRASEAGRRLLDRKIAKLDELLDGPQPEWMAPKPKQAKPVRSLPVLTEEELLESARLALQNGWMLTQNMREVLKRHGEAVPT